VQIAALALPTGARARLATVGFFFDVCDQTIGAGVTPAQRDQVAKFFLDARYQLTQTVASGAPDPVTRLFLTSWDRLAPVLKRSLSTLSPASAAQFTSFISAMDGIKSLAGVGAQFGLFPITPMHCAARRSFSTLATSIR
jgi:hypothetical protein